MKRGSETKPIRIDDRLRLAHSGLRDRFLEARHIQVQVRQDAAQRLHPAASSARVQGRAAAGFADAAQHLRQILFQFLAEAVLISVIGGFAGLTIGLILGGLLDLVTGFPLIPTTTGILVGFLVSVLVGLASGYYPAQRAAGYLPVEALRRD